MNSYSSVIAVVLAVICAAGAGRSIYRSTRVPREPGRIGFLLSLFGGLGIAMNAALLNLFWSQSAGWRYVVVYAGLVVGPLIFTAGYTAAMSRRYRHAPQGTALLWLGALCGVLLYLVISRGRG